MFVHKRGGRRETVHFDKITSRIQKLCYGLNMDFVDPCLITQKVINGLYPGVTTVELDNLAAETAATMTTKHPDYAILAARIAISNLHKETKKVFSEVVEDLYNMVNEKTRLRTPMISDETYKIVMENAEAFNSAIIYDRDFNYNFFGFKGEELERCRVKMEKMEARIEDLQELLNEKVKLQSQLSVENAKLRETSEKQNRKLSRLDMRNEELSYKLRESANVSYVREGNQPRSRNSPQKRFSVTDPTSMSQSWHADRSRPSAGRISTSTPHVHLHSQTLPRSQATLTDEFPDKRKIRRSMSESSPPEDIQIQLFGACCNRTDDSVDEEAADDDGGSCCYSGPKCSQDDLLRLTWVKEDPDLQNGAESLHSPEAMGSS